MNAEIYADTFGIKMNNVTKELSVYDKDGNWVTIYANMMNLKALKELIEQNLPIQFQSSKDQEPTK